MQAEPSATSAPKFVVEVSFPYSATRQPETIRCTRVEGLAECLEEQRGASKVAAAEMAQTVVDGERVSEENPDEYSEVEAWIEGSLVGGRS